MGHSIHCNKFILPSIFIASLRGRLFERNRKHLAKVEFYGYIGIPSPGPVSNHTSLCTLYLGLFKLLTTAATQDIQPTWNRLRSSTFLSLWASLEFWQSVAGTATNQLPQEVKSNTKWPPQEVEPQAHRGSPSAGRKEVRENKTLCWQLPLKLNLQN